MNDQELSEHAKAMSSVGASLGGKARAEKLTPEERKKIAREAAEARWNSGIPLATHTGKLEIAGRSITCAVLENGQRVITQETFLEAIGRSPKGKGGQIATSPDGLPPFLAAENIKPFVSDDLRRTTVPLVFKTISGGKAYGYEAKLLPMVCEVYLKAKDEKKTTRQQEHIVKACGLLMRGLAQVGIVALVDEATGFQYDRARRALEDILEQFISKELLKWAKMFPDDFYKELFRLKQWRYSSTSKKRPILAGKLTNDLVYQRLAPCVLEELKKVTPRDDKGRLKHKYFQRLTEDVGHPRLREHLSAVIALMRAFEEWPVFYKALNRALPPQVQNPLLEWAQSPDRADVSDRSGMEDRKG